MAKLEFARTQFGWIEMIILGRLAAAVAAAESLISAGEAPAATTKAATSNWH
jgi:hypothetical protein